MKRTMEGRVLSRKGDMFQHHLHLRAALIMSHLAPPILFFTHTIDPPLRSKPHHSHPKPHIDNLIDSRQCTRQWPQTVYFPQSSSFSSADGW